MSESSNEERKEQIRFHQQSLGRLVLAMPKASSLIRGASGGWIYENSTGSYGTYQNPTDALTAGLPVKLVSTDELNLIGHRLQSALDIAKSRADGLTECLTQFANIQDLLRQAIEKVDNL